MAYIPPPLITIILSKLPVKSLLRFRCVSKSWRYTIDSSHFINLHLENSLQSTTNHTLIVRSCYLYSVEFPKLDCAIEIDHPLKTPSFGTEILGSCNGLLCLSNSHENDYGGTIIYNPLTKKQRKLPVSGIQFPDYFTGCDRMVYGFGYDHVSDDYKLVRVIQFFEQNPGFYDSEVKVFSLKTNSWKRVQDFPHEYYLCYKRANGVYVNGCVHWVVTWENESNGSKLIVAFDFGLEEFKVVPQPEYSLSDDLHMNVGELNGCLYWMCNYPKVCTDVWVMEEYGVKESWTKKFSVAQPGILGKFDYVLPIAFAEDGSNVLLDKDGEYFVWYDVQRKRAKRVNVRGMPKNGDIAVLVQSLVLGSRRSKSKRNSKTKRDDTDGLATSSNSITDRIAEEFPKLPF